MINLIRQGNLAKSSGFLIGFAILIYFPLFGYMDWLPLKKFDESRLAVNAVEMLHKSNFVTTYYEGSPDMWNTKPPLLIWLQALSIKCFGMSEFSVRFPSAVAALFICVILFFSSFYLFQNWFVGIFSILVLITSPGFVNMHGSRSGDYDTLLTLFLFLNGIAFYLYTNTQKRKFAVLFFISLTLGMLTKGIAGCFFIPIYLVYLCVKKKMSIVFRWDIVLFFFVSVSIVLSYYGIREHENPGYLSAVFENELGGRFLNTLEGHSHPFSFYFLNFIQHGFPFWVGLGIIGIFVFNYQGKNFVRFCSLVGIFFLLIISFSQTKLLWYDMPIYPFFSIVVASGIYFIFKSIEPFILSYAFVFCLFIIPYVNIFSQIYLPRNSEAERSEYNLCEYIRENKIGLSRYPNLHIHWVSYNAQNLFYTYILKELNPSVRFNSNFKVGDRVLLYQDEVEKTLKEHYNLKLVLYSEKYKTKIYELYRK